MAYKGQDYLLTKISIRVNCLEVTKEILLHKRSILRSKFSKGIKMGPSISRNKELGVRFKGM